MDDAWRLSWTSLPSFEPPRRTQRTWYDERVLCFAARTASLVARMHWQTAGPHLHQQQDLHRVSHGFPNVVFRARVCCGMHPFLHGLTQISFGTWRWRQADGPQEWVLLVFNIDSTKPGRACVTRPHMSLTTMSLNVFLRHPICASQPSQSHKNRKKPIAAPPRPTDTLNPKSCTVPVKDERRVDVAWFVDVKVTPKYWEAMRKHARVRRRLSSWRRRCWWQSMAMAFAAWRGP